jgi:hypothetical protein
VVRKPYRPSQILALKFSAGVAVVTVAVLADGGTEAQQPAQRSFEIYGFAQADYIQDFDRVNPNWEDTLRPSRIPTTEGLYGGDGQAIISVRQSRFGVRGSVPVGGQELKTQFEFDLFGVGVDEGQTTIRLRHAYGQWGRWLAGQTNSVFMDIDVFPNTVDYWGPTGMVFLRNPQIRWTPIGGDNELSLAIEKPSNDIDPGNFRLFDPALLTIQNDEELPDFTAHFRMNRDWGHWQIAALARRVGGENIANPANIVERDDTGWGVDLTSSIKVGKRDKIMLGAVYGEGIASYMNDGGVDLAPSTSLPGTDVEAVPLLGIIAYYDHYWSDRWSSSIGYSSTEVDNTAGQEPSAFKKGQYASLNILHIPAEDVLVGAEVLWGEREDLNGASGSDVRLQISVKYSFGAKL